MHLCPGGAAVFFGESPNLCSITSKYSIMLRFSLGCKAIRNLVGSWTHQDILSESLGLSIHKLRHREVKLLLVLLSPARHIQSVYHACSVLVAPRCVDAEVAPPCPQESRLAVLGAGGCALNPSVQPRDPSITTCPVDTKATADPHTLSQLA